MPSASELARTEEEAAPVGHNSGTPVPAEELRNFIERVEHLEEEKKSCAADIKDVYAEAKATGFDPKIMRKVIAERRKEAHVRNEERAIFDTYLAALGLL